MGNGLKNGNGESAGGNSVKNGNGAGNGSSAPAAQPAEPPLMPDWGDDPPPPSWDDDLPLPSEADLPPDDAPGLVEAPAARPAAPAKNTARPPIRRALAALPAQPAVDPRRVTVTIRSTGDKERDVRRLRRIHGLLLSYPGVDRFEFDVYEYDGKRCLLQFPNDTTGFGPALERQLGELLGPDAVQVQPLLDS